MSQHIDFWEKESINRDPVSLIQINLGNRCHLSCEHCHVGASPAGKNNMTLETAQKIIEKIHTMPQSEIEFTGGTPEMNESLELFITELGEKGRKMAVRSGLTLLAKAQYRHFVELYKKYNVKLIASLPAVFEESTDRQRGDGVFQESIDVFQMLNKSGFGTGNHALELVYNPSGTYLPTSQNEMESQYREILKSRYDISFDSLVAIINTPIGRYRDYLEQSGELAGYMSLLKKSYNPYTIPELMCRHFISVDFQGYVYDCDFNQAIGLKVKGYEESRFWEIDFDNFTPEITFGDHCYACSAGEGSSCHGALTPEKERNDVTIQVKNYYGTELSQSADLKTNACCTTEEIPARVKKALAFVPDEVLAKYYGCGSPFPPTVENMTILDLGCGTGRDVYALSYLAGENAKIYGIDMTTEQIEVAKKHRDEHAKNLGYKEPNVAFIHDYIENIDKHFEPNSVDIVVSNCVVNLMENKEEIFRKVFTILKNGGEFYFSDVYADRRIPVELRKDPVLYGECLSGALYSGDFIRYARKAGFVEPRSVSISDIDIENEEIEKKVGNIKFCSITYRLWKLEGLEDKCEDYGHVAIYRGGITESPDMFMLDDEHYFEKNRAERICGNTALMLSQTRYAQYFDLIGDFREHFGEFTVCGTMVQPKPDRDKEVSCNC